MFFKKVNVPQTYYLIDSPKKLSWVVDQIFKAEEIAFDIETNHPTKRDEEKNIEYRKENEIKVAGVSFAWGRTKVERPWNHGQACYIPLLKTDDRDYWGSNQKSFYSALKDILESPIPKCAHNGKFDTSELFKKLGIWTQNFTFDTMLAHVLIDEERRNSSPALKSEFSQEGKVVKVGVSDYFLDIAASDFRKDLDFALEHYDPYWKRYSKIPIDTLYPYACADADLTLSLRYVFQEMMEVENTWPLFNNIVMPLNYAVTKMEMHGVPLDISQARKVEKEQAELMQELKPKIIQLFGKEIDFGSNQALGRYLFEELRLPGGEKNKNGWIVDIETLEKLDHPAIPVLSEWRRAQKLHSTYAVNALSRIEEITHHGALGWIHPSIYQDATTGRLTTKNPNFTNQPKPEKGGRIIKGMYRCPDDYVFIFKDESQIELRVIAHVSNEPVWVDGFQKGYDMHAAMAHKVWHLPCSVEEVKDLYKPERSKAKAINFGIAFGESEYSLAERLDLTVEEASYLINEEYFGAAPVLKESIEFTHRFAQENGYVTNIFGRRRHLPDAMVRVPNTAPWPKDDEKPKCYREIPGLDYLNMDEDDLYEQSDIEKKIVGILKAKKFSLASQCATCPFVRSCTINRHVKNVKSQLKRALRQSFNMVIQGSAADMVSLALTNINRELEENRIDSHPVLYIHDELGLYTHKSEVERVCKIMDYYMTDFLVDYTGFRVPLEVDTEIVSCWGDKK